MELLGIGQYFEGFMHRTTIDSHQGFEGHDALTKVFFSTANIQGLPVLFIRMAEKERLRGALNENSIPGRFAQRISQGI